MAGSISDQLLKMGLVDEKQAKQAKHRQRQENSKKGRRGVEAARVDRRALLEANQAQARQADKDRERGRQDEVALREAQNRIAQIVQSGSVRGRTGGRKRFYYESRDGRVPYLELNDETVDGLDKGSIALAEEPSGRIVLVDGDCARRIAELDPMWLALWNRP